MNLEGAKPIVIPRYGSKCQWDDSVNLPLGLADIARNVRYTAQGVATRFGHSTRIKISQGDALTAVGLLRYLAAQPGTLNLSAVETVLLMAYDAANGTISKVAPFIESTLAKLTNAAFYANTGFTQDSFKNLNPVIAQGFNKAFFAMGDLLLPQQGPLVYLPITDTLYPASELPFGAPWTPNTFYRVGQVVSPSEFQTFGQPGGQGTWVPTQTGLLYQVETAGVSAAVQPDWPDDYNSEVADGGVLWRESTPIFISGLPDPEAPTVAGTVAAGFIPDGATVYLAATLLNSRGEGVNKISNTQGTIDTSKVLVWKNTSGAAVNLQINMPDIAPYLQTGGVLGPTFGATGLNLYGFIDSDSSAEPATIVDPASYALLNTGGPLASGDPYTVTAFPSGQQLPQTSTAATTDQVGNVDTGLRYLTVMFQTQTGYITGYTNSAPVPVNVTQSGWPIQCLRAPVGPYQIAARVIASTVAGASSAGPYSYVSQADVESPGFNQPDVPITSTTILDNVTTVAVFNFTDNYLPGASIVTKYFNRIQIPPVVDVYFWKSQQRMVYTGAVGYQSAHLVSDIGADGGGESIRIPGSDLTVSDSDGDRCICFREVRGIPISFKENAGFAVEVGNGDPRTWGARKLWEGTAPVGPKAIDVAGSEENDVSEEFAVWGHRNGLSYWAGAGAKLVGREALQDWETINWEYGHLLTVRIDHTRRLIYIMAPTNGSTTINARWTVSYFFGLGDPIVFVPRRGQLVPNVEGRKWSQDDFSGFNFNDAVYIPAKSKNSVQRAGLDVAKQMVFAASDGTIKTVTENQYWDEDYNGGHLGYISQWRGVLGDEKGGMYSKCIGGSFFFAGNGLLVLYAYDENLNPYLITTKKMPFLLTPGKRIRRDLPLQDVPALSKKWAVSFDNGGVAGAWWEAFESTLYKIDMWASLPG
jgi:hypothetical protein